MSDNKRIAKNTMFLYIRMFLIMGVTLYTSRIILKQLGIEDYGLYNVVGGIVTMFSFLNGSLAGATSRFITIEIGREDYVKLNKIFNVSLVTHIAIALLIVLLAETVGLWFFKEKMTIPEPRYQAAFWVYQISIATTFFSLTQIPYNATIIAHENMRIFAYVGIVEVLAKLGIVYLLTLSPIDKLVFYALLLFILQVSIMLFYRYYCNKKYSETSLSFCREKTYYKNMFVYAGSDLIGNLAVLAQGQGLNILLNIFFGPAVNAARGIAYQVQGAVTQFSNNFMTAVRPQIIKLYAKGEIKKMLSLVVQSSNFSYYLIWLICFPIILEAESILTIWLGEYPTHTTSFLTLILILVLIQTIKTPRTTVFHATGHIFRTNVIVGSILVAAFPLAYILLKLGNSAESVFWSAIITMLISEIASVLILKRYINFSISRYFLQVHGRCILVTVVSFILPYYFYDKFIDEGFLRIVFTGMLTTISVATTSLFLGMDRSMRNKLFQITMAKIKKI